MKKNLISTGVLDDKGFLSKTENGIMKIIKGSLVVMRGIKKNGLYVLQGKAITGESATVQTEQSAEGSTIVQTEQCERAKLWH